MIRPKPDRDRPGGPCQVGSLPSRIDLADQLEPAFKLNERT